MPMRVSGTPLTSMHPIARSLPSNVAASVGRTIHQYSILEWSQANVLYDLLDISIKQGRAAVRVPPYALYLRTVRDLLEFHKLQLRYPWADLSHRLARAELARNTLAHSIFLKRGDGRILIQLVRGRWDIAIDPGVSMSRKITPEGQLIDRAFLKKMRNDVDSAKPAVARLRTMVKSALKSLETSKGLPATAERAS